MTCPDCGCKLQPYEVTGCQYYGVPHCEACWNVHVDAAWAALENPWFVPVCA